VHTLTVERPEDGEARGVKRNCSRAVAVHLVALVLMPDNILPLPARTSLMRRISPWPQPSILANISTWLNHCFAFPIKPSLIVAGADWTHRSGFDTTTPVTGDLISRCGHA
jgi:hypothetical protein